MSKPSKLERSPPGRGIRLAVEACSLRTIDALIDVANEREAPVMLRVSRSAADQTAERPGRLRGLDSASLVAHIRERDRKDVVLVARDRAGPDPLQEGADADHRARVSLVADLEAGFDLVHLDLDQAFERSPGLAPELELQISYLDHLEQECRRLGRELPIEIGAARAGHHPERFDQFLQESLLTAAGIGLERAWIEMACRPAGELAARRFGSFHEHLSMTALDELTRAAEAARRHDLPLRLDALDHLPSHEFAALLELPVSMLSVGEEIGMLETMTILDLCDASHSPSVRGDFLQLAHASGGWRSVQVPGHSLSDLERSLMCGHLVFGSDEFAWISDRLRERCARQGMAMDQVLYETLKTRLSALLSAVDRGAAVKPAS